MELLLGFVIATAIGLTGVGAGSITAPVLILFLGMTPAEGVGTALAFAAVIKLSVMPVYLWRKQVSYRILVLLCAGGIPGVLLGFWLIGKLGAHRHETVLFLLLGATVLVAALHTLRRSLRKHAEIHGSDRPRWLPMIAAGIGAEVGFSSAGAGALGSLALMRLTTLVPAQVVGTDMLFGLVVSTLGGGMHVLAGHYDGATLLKLVVGGIAGAFTGANLSAVIPPKPLRVGLAACLAILGAELCWRALG